MFQNGFPQVHSYHVDTDWKIEDAKDKTNKLLEEYELGKNIE